MIKEFKKEYFETRDSTLKEIMNSQSKWFSFLMFWSKILDSYSIDNVLNLYSYNPYGKVFMTFDDWNDPSVNRRIKSNSKGIPIIEDDSKVYVFDIKQTHGQEYKVWNYKHLIDDMILDYYKRDRKMNINEESVHKNYYKLFNEISYANINSYVGLTEDEEEFIANTMTLLFLSKANFNIYNFITDYEINDTLDLEDILKCMEIANKETAIIYNQFSENAISIENISEELKKLVIDQYRNNDFITNSDLEAVLLALEIKSGYDYEFINNIYSNLFEKYSYINEKERKKTNTNKENNISEIEINYNNEYVNDENTSEKEYFNNNYSLNKKSEDKENLFNESNQLSLFEPREESLANKICDIFNSFDTKYQNTFEISNVELQRWEHISSKKRNLTILLKSPLADDMGENSFTYFNSDKTDEIKLNNEIIENAFLNSLCKDKDFSISFSPSLIHIFWHNFDEKNFDLNVSSTKNISRRTL